MRARPGFTAAAVLMLALGIGMNAAVFSVINSVLFKGFRLVRDNGRLLYIGVQRNGRGCCACYPDFLDWREQAKSFEGMGVVADLKITLRDGTGYPETFSATQISADGFQLLGQRPIIGRTFSPPDEAPGAARVAILTHGFWERRYGGRAGIVGEVVSINGEPTTVIGVMPKGFSFPQNQDLWVPLVHTPDLQKRDVRSLWFAFGRMAKGVTRESAAAELETIGNRLALAYPLTNDGWVPRPLTFTEFFVGRNATMTYGALWGAVGFVLLIACANVANLMLARSIGRSREVSVRMALGAGRWRIVRQLLVESVVLSSIGGICGWGIATWGVRTYALAANPPTRDWSDQLLDYTMDYGVLTYLVAISIGTGLLFGLIPALRMWKVDVNAALKEGGRGAIVGGGKRISSLLIVGEMALAIVLLTGAGVMIRSFLNIQNANIGVTTANISTMMLTLPTTRYPDADSQASFYDRIRSRLATISGVESITVASTVPAGGTRSVRYELAGAAPVAVENRPTVWLMTISPAYFRTVGATVLSGREFNDFDGRSGPVAIVNERFARMHWPAEDPLGKRLRLFDERLPNAWLTVVGVVSNILLDVTRPEADPLVYVSYQQRPLKDMWVLARTAIPPGPLGNSVRRAIETVDPDLPIWLGPFTLDQRLAGMGNYWNTRNDALVLLVFAVMALLLASFGLYAVIAHSVSQRTQEIGIRMAIGATARDILQLVWAQGLRPLALGLAIGLSMSVGVNQVLRSQLTHVSPSDPVTLIVASVVLVVCAAMGCLIPARRAIGIDPLVALRDE
jgi:putative ABC transport system permease protein